MRHLITGITGQDGAALGQILHDRGDEVWGMIRWSSVGTPRVAELRRRMPRAQFVFGDLCDRSSLDNVLTVSDPDNVFNLGALASSGQSWDQPMMMAHINAVGVLNLLEAIRDFGSDIHFVQASTSEQYGRVNELPQSEHTPFGSLNVYGIAKTFAHQATINYRDSYGLHASTALMHNHVSYDRNPYFVDRKITQAAARIKAGLQGELRLGNLNASRDWGWGPEYMAAWALIAERSEPGDFVLCTGESHSISELLQLAFETVGLDASRYVVRDQSLTRPTDVAELRGDPTWTTKTLGWTAQARFPEIVRRLVEHDLAELA